MLRHTALSGDRWGPVLSCPQAIYDDFVTLLTAFDKGVMLDLVEDALKDAHDAALLASYTGSTI